MSLFMRKPGGIAPLAQADISRVIEMAWEDRTPFEAIQMQFGLNESNVVCLMREQLKRSAFEMWRQRMKRRQTKHVQLRHPGLNQSARHQASHRTAQR
jgi:uncharacterized protein (TIGR03643 family)